jgi:crossover junction endodeoxyribonuclease RuvC
MRILGIDPGSVATGYGVVERRGAGAVHVAHGTLRPPRSAALPARLAFLHAEVARLVARLRPDAVAVEQVFAGRNALSALVLGQARGAVLAALASAGVPIREVPPQHVKLAATGTGAAEKAQVQAMVRRLLALPETPQRDAADALAAALCVANEGRLAQLQTRLDRVGARPSGRARNREPAVGSAPNLVVRRIR